MKGINTSDTHSACSSFVLSRNRYLKVEMNHHHMFFWLIRVLDDMRLWVILNFVPCIAIPAMLFLFPPKYTHSRFWFLATGNCN